jgi:hypothetical protein
LNAKVVSWRPDSCIEQARQCGADTLILSSEAVSTQSREQFRTLADCFSTHDLTYLFCFRLWGGYLRSRWSQNCRRRDSQNFADYVHTVAHTYPEHADFRFDRLLDRVASSGARQVKAVSYDNAIAEVGSVVPVLLRVMELSQTLIACLTPTLVWDNAGEEPMLVEATRLFNGIIADRMNLQQDDLCRSVAEHRGCRGFFDVLPQIASLENNMLQRVFSTISDREIKTMSLPDTHDAYAALTSGHGHRFCNLADGQIFAVQTAVKHDYSDLSWQDFRVEIGEIAARIG